MADFITNSLPAYTKEDANKYFFQPLVMGNVNLRDFDTMYNVKSAQALSKMGAANKVTKAYSKGFSGVAGSTVTQRVVSPVRVEAEIGEDGGVFYNSILGEFLKLGVSKDDFTGTQLQQIVAQLFLNGVQSDLNRQVWLNDTASGSADYNLYDGIFKQYASLPAGQKLVGAIGALGTDAAVTEFEQMLAAAPYEMKEKIEMGDASGVVLEVSYSYAQNYRETLQAKGTEQGNTRLIDGVAQLMWNGIPIKVHTEWDKWISADTLSTDVHRAVLHDPKNVAVATDLESTNLEFWYNIDEQEVRMRYGYIMGTQYKTDELAVTSISA
jgi:hypothetical protein